MKGFINFIREQGVIGLAVGFILGGAVSKVVTSLVSDLVNPVLGIVLGATGDLSQKYFQLGNAHVKWGSFANSAIDFLVIALVVYAGVKLLGIDKWDGEKK